MTDLFFPNNIAPSQFQLPIESRIKQLWLQEKPKYQIEQSLSREMLVEISKLLSSEGNEESKIDFFRTLLEYFNALPYLEIDNEECFEYLQSVLKPGYSDEITEEQTPVATLLVQRFSAYFFQGTENSILSNKRLLFLHELISDFPNSALMLIDSLISYFDSNFRIRISGKIIQYGEGSVTFNQQTHDNFLRAITYLHEDWCLEEKSWVGIIKESQAHVIVIERFFATVNASQKPLDETCQEIGRGVYGRVYDFNGSRFSTNTNYKLVVKVASDKEALETLEKEAKTLMKFRSSAWFTNIINIYADSVGMKGLVLENCGSDLKSITEEYQLELFKVMDISQQVLTAVAFLEERTNIAHLDLKLENLMMDSNGHVKVGDFGLSQTIGKVVEADTIVTRWLRSPELVFAINADVRVTRSIDRWSLGCVITQLVTKRYLFEIPEMDRSFFKDVSEYQEAAYAIFISKIGVDQTSKLPHLIRILKESVAPGMRNSPLLKCITTIAIGLLNMQSEQRMSPVEALSKFDPSWQFSRR